MFCQNSLDFQHMWQGLNQKNISPIMSGGVFTDRDILITTDSDDWLPLILAELISYTSLFSDWEDS